MSKRKKASFQKEWLLKYGLEVTTKDLASGVVTSVLCLFCRHCGREDNAEHERKRKRTQNAKYFSSPWRSDNFT
jgi:hypothetical protein